MVIRRKLWLTVFGVLLAGSLFSCPALAQLVDNTQSSNSINAGINKSYFDEIGAGRGDANTPDSSIYIIKRDPFRAIRRGRQLFQRKFIRGDGQGQGPRINDGQGDIMQNPRLGAGLADSCASCHGRPRGAAGFGGDVATRPDSRDTPHLFGLGLKEMLADEITGELRAIRDKAIAKAHSSGKPKTMALVGKGINYGTITAYPDGSVATAGIIGVDPDLRVRPFFVQGGTISIREFIVGAARGEMGIEAVDDPDLKSASMDHNVVTTPSGMVLDGQDDAVEAPPSATESLDPTNTTEMPASIVDFLEFYLLNYFSPATYKKTAQTELGRIQFLAIGCGGCHIPNLQINHDRRLANIQTAYDSVKGGFFNKLYATVTSQFVTVANTGSPAIKDPVGGPFLVQNIFTDFKRHNLGPNFYERNYDGSFQTEFMTRPLWGVGSTAPYGHDGRSINLTEVILRHGGEAQRPRDIFAKLNDALREPILEFLNSLVIFPPDDTASDLDKGDPTIPNYPQIGHGSIKLTVLFNNPGDPE
jgi:hypothetical protein